MVIQNIVSYTKRDRFAVPEEIKKAYPGIHFVWIEYKPPTFDKVIRMEGNGYTLIRPNKEYKDKFKGTMIGEADVIRRSDQVLMGCSEEMYRARETEKEDGLKSMSAVRKSEKQIDVNRVKKGIKVEQDVVAKTNEKVHLDSEQLESMKNQK
jgi:hypothetical protein